MPVKRDENAICYWVKCPNCGEIHVAVNHHFATLGDDWHKKDCPFINPGGVYTTFTAHPIYHTRDKIFRKLDKKWQKFFIDQHEKRVNELKALKE